MVKYIVALLVLCVMPRICEPIEYVAQNWVKASGWQLSGWSKVGVDKNLNRWRFKVGIISEMDALSKYDRDTERGLRAIDDWDNRRSRKPAFGIFFVKEF